MLEKHSEVLKNELGCITDVEAKFQIDDSVEPWFLKARPVPYHVRDRVNDELSILEREGNPGESGFFRLGMSNCANCKN